ncbi:MAG TPA: hypothetical protein VMR33_08595 [Candidatus Baltobacteraceae bacterium]|jgi:hypothetical protein|nr:hypothetical protein [Candidatus Baltobacteraceae bacterium]
MINVTDLTTNQLHKIIAIKGQIEKLQGRLDSLVSDGETHSVQAPKKRRLSAAGRARIAAGARARWARVKEKAPKASKGPKKGKRRLSAAGRAAIIAGTKARWAKVKGTQVTSKAPKKKDRRMSPAVKAKLAAIAKARWAKVKAEGKKTL